MSRIPSSVLTQNSEAWRLLNEAARHARVVVFCGIPGVGKSFLLREQIRIATAAGRKVTLLQWDVSRQAFEIPSVLHRYPEVAGTTHVMIRRAVGLWCRQALVEWSAAHSHPQHLLLVEAPLVGGRLAELAHRCNDDAETLLSRSDVRFYVPTPTVAVRRVIAAARRAEIETNRHVRDAANAIPTVVDELWQMVVDTARKLAIEPTDSQLAYSPDLYFAVYQAVLRHRAVSRVMVEEIVTASGSPHELDEPQQELSPAATRVAGLIAQVEKEGHEAVAAHAALWYDT